MKNTLTNQKFLVTDNRSNIDNWRKDKYTKFLVTIALRLGIALDDNGSDIDLNFSGNFSEHNDYHESDNYIGTLIINHRHTLENIKICTRKNSSRIETLWPIHDDNMKQEQSKHNKTSDFIEYYISGEQLFTIKDIAEYYHPVFVDKPGLPPIALEKEVCANHMHALRQLHKQEIGDIRDEFKTLKEAHVYQLETNRELENARINTDISELVVEARANETVTSRPRKILADVKLEDMHTKNRGTVQGVVLYFDDGTSVKNNWDNGSQRKKVIEKLKGREVMTDVWGDFASEKWFANVYLK